MLRLRGSDATRTIWAIALLLGIAVVSASVDTALSGRAAALADARDDLASVLDSVAQDVAGTFELSDTVLTSLANSIRAGDGTRTNLHSVSGDVAMIARAAPRLQEIMFAELGGWVLASSREKGGVDRNVSREPFFRQAADAEGSTLVVARVKADEGVAASRQVDLADGSVAGVVSVVVPRAYFLRTYAAFDAGRGIVVSLRGADGAALLASEAAVGADAIRIERDLAPLPVIASVSWSRAGMLREWSGHLPFQAATAVGFLALIALVASLLSRLLGRREAERRALALQAATDPLTGLGNRRTFMEGVRAAVGDPGIAGFAVALIDLDRFKAINDTYGHGAGDLVLVETARRLTRALGPFGTVARLGGDEFAAVIRSTGDGVDPETLLAGAQQELLAPIPWRDAGLAIGASVGIARFPQDGGDGDTLLQRADLAMYHAKQNRLNEVRAFEPGMEASQHARLHREAELRLALERGEIRPYYQPIVAFPDRRVAAFELLARWHHPTLGVLGPGEFIALAEETQLITPMTVALIHQAAADAASWPDGVRLAINISPRQLREPLLAAQIIEALRTGGLAPSRVEIELTEDGILDDYELAKSVLAVFRLHGMTLALDDFGTGYSSLSHLRELRFDRLKIDRSFVQTLPDNRESGKLVDAILQLAASFDLAVTAEGIETDGQAAFLAGRGGVSGQGYLFGRPMSGTDAKRFLGAAEAAA